MVLTSTFISQKKQWRLRSANQIVQDHTAHWEDSETKVIWKCILNLGFKIAHWDQAASKLIILVWKTNSPTKSK